eukprot:CAMPEP_0183306830 /NCGR_PEP_ID=MMETSP0160_2-20130417/14862_1 /TAXON_ID=2839 ORGANISM="Odontella Sinensis, Strain Grunow 1884" /NCGR_SAMPLE_ID=MMETSP0160_2 /ASSEMBLY_ACC=CAM_ASM_000250 /LENGTH=214 /DNA_ID=CAMNT_0025470297 /DNA_START=47 /DNA_END=691 /DNA_ORIENTATION=-
MAPRSLSSLLVLAAAAPLSSPFAPQSSSVPTRDASLGLFGLNRAPSSAPKGAANSPAADDAVALFNAKFAKKRTERRPIVESTLRSNFAELVAVFGDTDATEIVKAVPQTLEMDRSYFARTLDIYSEKFGAESARGLLLRNPALLGVKPEGWGPDGYGGAESAGPETIALSYVVAATRPIGKFGPIGLVGLLSVPGIEMVTGIPIRETIFGALN